MSGEIVKSNDKIAGNFLQEIGERLNEYAIRSYNKSSFLKSAMVAIVNNESLCECLKSSEGKMSIFNALRYASTTGLSLNPQEGKAALIAYKNKNGKSIVNYQIMKNGMVEIALESGRVEFITADYVKENDKFSLKKSVVGDDYEFQPALKNRGDVIGFYAALKLRGGGSHVKWMTIDEMYSHRDKYSATFRFKKESSPWFNAFESMGIKTVMKALLRNVQISSDLDNAIGTDDFFECDFKVEEKGVDAEGVIEKMIEAEKKIDLSHKNDLL